MRGHMPPTFLCFFRDTEDVYLKRDDRPVRLWGLCEWSRQSRLGSRSPSGRTLRQGSSQEYRLVSRKVSPIANPFMRALRVQRKVNAV